MNFKSITLVLAFSFFLINNFIYASGHLNHFIDPLEKTFVSNPKKGYTNEVQSALQQQAYWQNFLKSNSTWKVVFDENSAMPHRAYGAPVAVPGSDVRSSAESFINNQLQEFRVPFNEMQFRSVSTNNKYHYVNYVQYFSGLEVLFSRVQVRITHDYRVNQFTLDCFRNIPLSVVPGINSSAAIQFASADVSGIQNSTVGNDLKVLPIPGDGAYNFHLVYEVIVENLDSEGIPGKYYTLVDASTGAILYRTNQVKHIANTDINVSGTLHLTHPYDPATVEPMKNMKVVEGGTTYYTDNTGFLGLTNTTMTSATFSLQGQWVRIRTNNVTPSWTVFLAPGANNMNIDANTDIKQRTTYNAINTIHEYMKSKYPAFTGLDYSMNANIDVAGNCNAFYNGTSVNFLTAGGGCNATSLIADVCYHEYGHGINDKFYQSQGFSFNNGAMNEGYADLWALGITTSPILAIGFYDNDPNGYLRRYDINKKVYPQDLVGESHADGEIIAGCFWDVGINLGNLQQMMDLFKETFYAGITGPNGTEGILFEEILIETLAQDDNDGDLTNGTPNYCAIVAGFYIHGIVMSSPPITCSPVSLFTYDPAIICEGATVNFDDGSIFADTWSWSFPGGTPVNSTDANPVITYNSAGVYDVTLTVTNASGAATLTQAGVITVLPASGQYGIPFTESFEAITFPGTEWPIENQGGNTWVQNTIAAKTGINSVYINNFSGNILGSTDVFVTPSYDLSWVTNSIMTFELAFANTVSTS